MTIARVITFISGLLLLMPAARADLTEQMIELPTCTLHVRAVKAAAEATGPRFIMMDGVPLSGAVFKNLAGQLSDRLNTTSTLIDFPGVGRSTLKEQNYRWSSLRECLRSYLASQPPFILVLGDLGLPVVAPLFPELPNLRGAVILNSVVKPSELHPPFPLDFLRCCPRRAVFVGSITPGFIFEKRIRDLGLGRPGAVKPEEIRALCAEMQQDHALRQLARLMSGIELNEEADQAILHGLATPIPQLYVWGQSDPVLGFEYKKLPPFSANQRLVVFPQARHFLMIDFADESADAIAKWYASVPSAEKDH